MLFRRRSVDGEDARQGDGRELNLRVLFTSMIGAIVILAVLYFAFGFGQELISPPGPATPPEVAAPPPPAPN
jgi:hypothetical protein